jgi:hypothetical protein
MAVLAVLRAERSGSWVLGGNRRLRAGDDGASATIPACSIEAVGSACAGSGATEAIRTPVAYAEGIRARSHERVDTKGSIIIEQTPG